MFQHAYNGYLEHAYPYDELRPLTCDGHDTWGRYNVSPDVCLFTYMSTVGVVKYCEPETIHVYKKIRESKNSKKIFFN